MDYNKEKNDRILEEFLSLKSEDEKFIQKQMDIAAQIDDYLKEKGWTQQELADRAKLRPSQISQLLAGEANPTLRTITKIEEALGKDVIVSPDFYEEDMEAKGWGRPNSAKFVIKQNVFREFLLDPSEIGQLWADESLFVQGSFKVSQNQRVSVADYPRLKPTGTHG